MANLPIGRLVDFTIGKNEVMMRGFFPEIATHKKVAFSFGNGASIISCSDDNFMVKDNIINYNWKNILTV